MNFHYSGSVLLMPKSSIDDVLKKVGRDMDIARFRPNLVMSGSVPYDEVGDCYFCTYSLYHGIHNVQFWVYVTVLH